MSNESANNKYITGMFFVIGMGLTAAIIFHTITLKNLTAEVYKIQEIKSNRINPCYDFLYIQGQSEFRHIECPHPDHSMAFKSLDDKDIITCSCNKPGQNSILIIPQETIEHKNIKKL